MIRSLTSAGSLTIEAVGVDRSATGQMNVVTMNALARSVFGHRVTLTSAGCIEAPKQQRERSAFGELQLEGDAGVPPEDPEDEGNYSALSAFGFITSGARLLTGVFHLLSRSWQLRSFDAVSLNRFCEVPGISKVCEILA